MLSDKAFSVETTNVSRSAFKRIGLELSSHVQFGGGADFRARKDRNKSLNWANQPTLLHGNTTNHSFANVSMKLYTYYKSRNTFKKTQTAPLKSAP